MLSRASWALAQIFFSFVQNDDDEDNDDADAYIRIFFSERRWSRYYDRLICPTSLS